MAKVPNLPVIPNYCKVKVGPRQVVRIEIINAKKNLRPEFTFCVQNLQLETFGCLQKVGQGPLPLSITDFDMKLSIS